MSRIRRAPAQETTRAPSQHASTSTVESSASTAPEIAPVLEAKSEEDSSLQEEGAELLAEAGSGVASAAAAAPNAPPSDPWADATGGNGAPVPFRAEMEQAFGTGLGHLRAHLGEAEALGQLGASGAQKGADLAFASNTPDKAVVAEEVAHAMQGGGGRQGSVSKGNEGAEKEARGAAAKVAAGLDPGPIQESRAADIHLHNKGDKTPKVETPKPPREETTGFGKYEVHPDPKGMIETLQLMAAKAKTEGFTVISESDFRRKGDAYKKQVAAREGLIKAAQATKGDGWSEKMAKEWQKVDPATAQALFADATFLNHEVWQGKPKLLVQLTSMMDPLAFLRSDITRKINAGEAVDSKFIQTWALAHGADCERAMMDGPTLSKLHMSMSPGELALSLQFLIGKGQLPQDARSKLSRALEAGNETDFLAAWAEVQADATLFETYRNDANFLMTVEAKLPAAVFEQVRTTIQLGGAAAANASMDLAPDEKEKIQAAAEKACKALRAEFNATFYTSDANVLSALNTYFGAVDSTIKAVTDEKAKASKKEKSRDLLKNLYLGYYGRSIEHGICAGMSGDTKKTALDLIKSQPVEGLSPTLEGGAPLKLTDSEKLKLQPHVETAIKELNAELNARFYCKDANVVAAVDKYERQVTDTVVSLQPGDPQHEVAVVSRRNDARNWLDREFLARYGKTIQAAVAAGMSGDEASKTSSYFAKAEQNELPPVEGSEYTPEISPAEEKRVQDAARTAATNLNSALSGMIVRDGPAAEKIEAARLFVIQAVHPRHVKGQAYQPSGDDARIFQEKSRYAMKALKTTFDAQFGSLVGRIHDCIQDNALRTRVLGLIGDRVDPNQTQMDAAMGSAANPEQAFVKLDAFNKEVHALASKLADELHDSGVFDWTGTGAVLNLCKQFPALKTKYADLPQIAPEFKEGDFLAWLNRAYAPLGGSLADAITGALKEKEASQALNILGMGSIAQATVARDEELAKKSSEAADAKQEITPVLQKLFYQIEQLPPASAGSTTAAGATTGLLVAGPLGVIPGAMAGFGVGMYDQATRPDRFQAIMGSLGKVAGMTRGLEGKTDSEGKALNPTQLVLDTYAQLGSIALTQHLGMRVEAGERTQIERTFPIRIPNVGRQSVEQMANTAKEIKTASADPQNKEYAFNPAMTKPGFTVDVAMDRAQKLYVALNSGSMNYEYTLTSILAGNAEENRLVKVVYNKIFGHTLDFDIKRCMGEKRADDADRFTSIAKTGGAPENWAVHLEALVSSGNLNEVYREVYLANPDQRKQALDNPKALYKVKEKFGEEAYDRVYRSLTGELSMGDMLRTRDSGTEWYTFGFGTDEKGTEDDIKLFFEKLKRDIQFIESKKAETSTDPEAAKKVGELVSAQVKQRARELFNDPDVAAMLDSEFSSDELLKMQQFVLGAGERSGTDEAYTDMKGLGTGSGIMDHIKSMTDAERERAKNDPTFLAWLADDLSGTQLQEALLILNSSKGSDGLADIENGLNSGTFSVDEKKVLDGVLSMSPEQLHILANDPIRVAKIRANLDDRADERQLFDAMIAEAKTLKPSGKGDANGCLSEEDVKAKAAHLVFKHSFGIKVAVYEGKDATLAAAQGAYNEEDEIQTDPANPNSKAAVFAKAQREQVWGRVGGLVNNELAKVPAWQKVLGAPTNAMTLGMTGELTQKAADLSAATYANVVKKAVLKQEDPSAFRLKQGIDGYDNDDAINGALEGVSKDYLAANWSNILKKGPSGQSMKEVYEAYRVAKADSEGAPENADKKNAMMMAKRALAWFSLDVSADLATVLADDGLLGRDEKKFLELKNKIRPRILELTGADIAKALGGSYQEVLDSKSSSEADKTRANTMKTGLDADADLLMNDTRKAVSEGDHSKDTYDHQRNQTSALDFMSDDYEKVDYTFAAYQGELNKGMEGDFEKGDAGELSAEELSFVNQRKGSFERSVAEYKAAKAAMADLFKWIAVALITAVATVLTGPGGPTLGAVLLGAMASASATALIDEAFLGNDFDLAMEGGKRVLVETVSAAATFGMSKGFSAVVGQVPFLKTIGNKFTALEESLKKGAEQGWGGVLVHSVYKSTLDTATKPFKDLPGDIIGSIDLGKLKYFDASLGNHMSREMEKKFDSMPKDLLVEWVTGIGSNVLEHAGDKTFEALGGKPKEIAGIPGSTPSETGFLANAKGSLKETLASADAINAVYQQAYGVVTAKIQAGNIFKASGWDEAEIGTFVTTWLKGRADKFVSTLAEKEQEDRNNELVEAELKKLSSKLDEFKAASVPKELQEASAEHLKAWLMKNGLNKSFADWQKDWNVVQGKVQTTLAGLAPADRDAYSKWLFQSADGVEGRLGTPPSKVLGALKEANAEVDKMKSSDGFKKLSAEQQSFYLATLNANSLVTVKAGAAFNGDVAYDLTTADGLKSFQDDFVYTKVTRYQELSKTATSGWPSDLKNKWESHLKSTPADKLPSLNPTLPALMQLQIDVYAATFKEANTPKPTK